MSKTGEEKLTLFADTLTSFARCPSRPTIFRSSVREGRMMCIFFRQLYHYSPRIDASQTRCNGELTSGGGHSGSFSSDCRFCDKTCTLISCESCIGRPECWLCPCQPLSGYTYEILMMPEATHHTLDIERPDSLISPLVQLERDGR